MVTSEFFSEQMTRLHRAFGVIPGEARMADRLASKIAEWFDMWSKTYQSVGNEILMRMVDRAIKDSDRLPTFAQFRVIRQSVQGDLPRQGYAKTPCGACDNGIVAGWRDVEGYGVAEYSFRCSSCENWRERFDGLPVWDMTGPFTAGRAPRPLNAGRAESYRPKGFPEVAGCPTLTDDDKERIRRDSLRREAEREQQQQREPGEDRYDAYSDLGFGKL